PDSDPVLHDVARPGPVRGFRAGPWPGGGNLGRRALRYHPESFDVPASGPRSCRVDDIIDLGEYLRRREEAEKAPRTAFAVWGGEGERARFALPLWRIVYLASGARGGLVWVEAGEERPVRLNPFVVLDLAADPARTRFVPQAVTGLEGAAAATL